MNWNAFTVSVLVGIIGVVSLLVGQTDVALMCGGALAGLLSPPPYKQ